jgi:hypothetical protein
MPRLNKTQTYAIQWLNSQNKQPIEIADELKLPEKQVLTVLEKTTQTTNQEPAVKTTKSPAGNRSQNLMIRHTAGKKTNNVSIMTGEASALHDELKNKTGFNPNTEKAIFRPRPK